MSNTCKDCFNGCLDRVPDNCVVYTGPDVIQLEITNGNSLAVVEEKLIQYLLSTLSGQGIALDLENTTICKAVKKNLPTSTTISLPDIIVALINTLCEYEAKISILEASAASLAASYDVKCLTTVTNGSNTHLQVQALIDSLCALKTYVNSVVTDLQNNYVTSSNINSYITNYNQVVVNTSLVSARMVPYTAIPYFRSSASIAPDFDSSGAGLLLWTKVYLCNGENGTPDLRGVTLIGATTGMMGQKPFATSVDIANPSNPNYNLRTRIGQNTVTLQKPQMPVHNHVISTHVLVAPHAHNGRVHVRNHTFSDDPTNATTLDVDGNDPLPDINVIIDPVTVEVGVTADAQDEGGGLAHANTQPGIGCYYIMYIP